MDRDRLTMQRETVTTLATLLDGAPEQMLRRRPSPDKWTAVAIVAHMAEDELVSSWRYRQMVEQSGAVLPGFDQDEWARLGDYDSWSVPDALAMFRLLREANLRMLSRLTPADWQCFGIHAERGRITVEQLARHMVGHDLNHLNQVRHLLGTS